MTTSSKTQLKLPASPERVLAALTSEAFLIERDAAQGAISVVVEEPERTEAKLVQRVTATQHVRGLTGIDKTKTEEAVTTLTWDLPARRATWTYQGPHGDRVTVQGTIALRAEGDDGTCLDETFTITFHAPLVGPKIEALVIAEMAKGFPAYERVVRRHVDAALRG